MRTFPPYRVTWDNAIVTHPRRRPTRRPDRPPTPATPPAGGAADAGPAG